MRADLRRELKEISGRLEVVGQKIVAETPCRLFATLRDCDDGRSVKLSGNAEGLAYFASILLGLATEESVGQHFHFEVGVVLDQADRDLILQFEPAEWDEPTRRQP